MPSRRLDKTPFDYLMIALAPGLIIGLVGSRTFFPLEVFYCGGHGGRLNWILFFFVFAAVLIARISFSEGSAHAGVVPWRGAMNYASIAACTLMFVFGFRGIATAQDAIDPAQALERLNTETDAAVDQIKTLRADIERLRADIGAQQTDRHLKQAEFNRALEARIAALEKENQNFTSLVASIDELVKANQSTTVGLWIAAAGVVLTMFGVLVTGVIGRRNLAAVFKQLWLQTFLGFTSRYGKIVRELPLQVRRKDVNFTGDLNDERQWKTLWDFFFLYWAEYQAFTQHMIDQRTWNQWTISLKEHFQVPVVREFWNDYFKPGSEEDFVRHIEQRVDWQSLMAAHPLPRQAAAPPGQQPT